jgi:hypothetical protein
MLSADPLPELSALDCADNATGFRTKSAFLRITSRSPSTSVALAANSAMRYAGIPGRRRIAKAMRAILLASATARSLKLFRDLLLKSALSRFLKALQSYRQCIGG